MTSSVCKIENYVTYDIVTSSSKQQQNSSGQRQVSMKENYESSDSGSNVSFTSSDQIEVSITEKNELFRGNSSSQTRQLTSNSKNNSSDSSNCLSNCKNVEKKKDLQNKDTDFQQFSIEKILGTKSFQSSSCNDYSDISVDLQQLKWPIVEQIKNREKSFNERNLVRKNNQTALNNLQKKDDTYQAYNKNCETIAEQFPLTLNSSDFLKKPYTTEIHHLINLHQVHQRQRDLSNFKACQQRQNSHTNCNHSLNLQNSNTFSNLYANLSINSPTIYLRMWQDIIARKNSSVIQTNYFNKKKSLNFSINNNVISGQSGNIITSTGENNNITMRDNESPQGSSVCSVTANQMVKIESGVNGYDDKTTGWFFIVTKTSMTAKSRV